MGDRDDAADERRREPDRRRHGSVDLQRVDVPVDAIDRVDPAQGTVFVRLRREEIAAGSE
jgi:hypothetical protein